MEKKKLIIIVTISVIIAFILGYIVGTSVSKTTSKKENTTGQTSQQISTISEDKKEEEPVKKEPTKINIGEQITNEDIEMTFASVDFKEEIKWSTGEHFSRSASIGEGKIGLSISGKFKNLRGSEIDESTIIGKVIVDDKYTYDLSFKPHTSSSYKIAPLEDVEYDFYAEVPQEVKDTYSKAEFVFGYNNDFGYISTKYVNGKMADKYESLENLYSITATK